MQKIKTFLGYFAAALAVPLVLATFIGMQGFSELLVQVSGVRVSPRFTGGAVVASLDHGRYQTQIYETVFEGLLWETSEGFVQVVWTPTSQLPDDLEEHIDYDQDGQADFVVRLQPGAETANLQALAPQVIGISGPYVIGDGLGVRIGLKNRR